MSNDITTGSPNLTRFSRTDDGINRVIGAPASDDIVNRLRYQHSQAGLPSLPSTYSEAADEIERLRAALTEACEMIHRLDGPDEPFAAYDEWKARR